ncbi:MAG: hypothetical protein ABI361_11000 [Nitrososphaera sp.]|jgi:hypothetical protein
MKSLDGQGFKYQNYASKEINGSFGRPDWICDKCRAVFSGYERLREHKRENHAYAIIAAVCGVELLSAISSAPCC